MQIPLIWCGSVQQLATGGLVMSLLSQIDKRMGGLVGDNYRVSGTEWSVTSKVVFAVWKQDSTIVSSHIL